VLVLGSGRCAGSRRRLEEDYNGTRPHSSLGHLTPDEFACRQSGLRSPPAPSAQTEPSKEADDPIAAG